MPSRDTNSARLRRGVPLALLVVLGCVTSAHLVAQTPASLSGQIQAALPGAEKLLSKAALSHGAQSALQQVYSPNGEALWTHAGQPTAQARALLEELKDAESYGLRAQDYGAADIAHLLDSAQSSGGAAAAPLARFDVRLTAAALHFISDLHFGRVSPEAAGFQLEEPREPYDLAQALRSVAGASDVPGALSAVEPLFYHYKLLKDSLARYRKMARLPALAPLPAIQTSVKLGDTYAGAPVLRQLLERTGDLPTAAAAGNDTAFDTDLSAGVRHYQERHGLTADGALGKTTLNALRTPIAQRLRQITLTLERWRWLPPFKTPPIIVNIPQFRLFAFRTTEDRVADILQMDVIVGRTYAHTQTPVFEKDMRYVVLRPYWDVPISITRKELLPKIRANPAYLNKERLEIVNGQSDNSPVVPPTPENLEALAAGRLRLRQQPGPDNALGLAKFIFPNSYNVYLHSTPARELFKQSVRAFSHGCIRVADPVALATLVLQDAPGEWTREKIQAAMNSGPNSQRVNLTQPINVLILYGTALAAESGAEYFFDDIYGYDKKLERQLGLTPVH